MDKIFIKNLRKLRKSFDLTQRELSEKVPFLSRMGKDAHKTYSKIEKGGRKATVAEAIELSRFFKVSLDILCFTEYPETKRRPRRMTLESDEVYRVLFPAVLDKTEGFDEDFVRGVRAYKRFFCGDEVDSAMLEEAFLSSWRTSRREEALVNYLSVVMCDGFSEIFGDCAVKLPPAVERTGRWKPEVKTFLSAEANRGAQREFYEKYDGAVLEAVKHLKKSPEWQELGDFYYALRYVGGMALLSDGYNGGATAGVLIMTELSKMGNKYAEAYFDLLQIR